MRKLLLILLSGMNLAFSPAAVSAATVNVSVAASLTKPCKEIVASFTAVHPDVEVILNFGASGMLAKQIVQGAPAELYISANRHWLDYLLEAGVLDAGTIGTLAVNRLVFVGAENAATSWADLPKLRRIAIGSPQSVPAGQYAVEALKQAGLYDQLATTGKLVQAQDVRQALLYADRGETDGAFVYKTDALLSQSAVILFEVPADMHEPISYPMALTTSGAGNPAARALMEHLRSAASRAVLARLGFAVE